MTSFFIPGNPAPQGSKTYLGQSENNKGRFKESSKRLKPWRTDIREEALKQFDGPFPGPLQVTLSFTMPRPKAHYRTGKLAHVLREDAPTYVAKRPDIDKLARAALDALKGIAWDDDSQVALLSCYKTYPVVAKDRAGLFIEVEELEAL